MLKIIFLDSPCCRYIIFIVVVLLVDHLRTNFLMLRRRTNTMCIHHENNRGGSSSSSLNGGAMPPPTYDSVNTNSVAINDPKIEPALSIGISIAHIGGEYCDDAATDTKLPPEYDVFMKSYNKTTNTHLLPHIKVDGGGGRGGGGVGERTSEIRQSSNSESLSDQNNVYV